MVDQPIKKKCEDDLLKFFLHGHYDVKFNYNKNDEQLIKVDNSVAILNDTNININDNSEQEIAITNEQSTLESRPILTTCSKTPIKDYYGDKLENPQCVYEETYIINISVKPKLNDVNKEDDEKRTRKSKNQTFAVSIEKTAVDETLPSNIDDDQHESSTEQCCDNNSLYESDDEYFVKKQNWTGPIITETASTNSEKVPEKQFIATYDAKSADKDLSLSDILHKTLTNIAPLPPLNKDINDDDNFDTGKTSTISSSISFCDDSKSPTYINEIIGEDWYIDENGIIQSEKYSANIQQKHDYEQLKPVLNAVETIITNTVREHQANSNYSIQSSCKDSEQDVRRRKITSAEIDHFKKQQGISKSKQTSNNNQQGPLNINEILKGNISDDEKLMQYLDYIERQSNQGLVVKPDTQKKLSQQQFQPSSTAQTKRNNNCSSNQINESKESSPARKPTKQKTIQTKDELSLKSRQEKNNLSKELDKIYRSLTVTDMLNISDEVRGKIKGLYNLINGDGGQNHQNSKKNIAPNISLHPSHQLRQHSHHVEAQCRSRQELRKATIQQFKTAADNIHSVRPEPPFTVQQSSYVSTSPNNKYNLRQHGQLKTSDTVDLYPSEILLNDQHTYAHSRSNVNLKTVYADRDQLLLDQHLKCIAMYNNYLRSIRSPAEYQLINQRSIRHRLPKQINPPRILEQHFLNQFYN
ncbi:unnamed protein product [Didymodactylos carnosus]|uniref:Uncharacterized protein n=1 Tax=Didymodactylos carnosus TaxID=1234261 RepID=A0A814Q0K2_9BILA|nr:unnamed protein product [Didymodactylos carnosus]CAF3877167.1 unnamed protein product [Didymodactylos carnosus]